MAHTWRFQRAGGFDQVVVDSAEDLKNLASLDQKLWVALACPVIGNEIDAATLTLVDQDRDGRIRAPELLAAVAWCIQTFRDVGVILQPGDAIDLANLADAEVLASAKRILGGAGKGDARTISVADTVGAKAILDGMASNGDGVVPPSTATDERVRKVIEEIVASLGGVVDRSAALGVDRGAVEAFWKALGEHEAWARQAEHDPGTILPLGAATAGAAAAYDAVEGKIEDYFTRCELAAFDARATPHLVGAESQWGDLAKHVLAPSNAQIAAFPLAAAAPGRPLPLTSGLNPGWVAAMQTFVAQTVRPLLGDVTSLDRAAWSELGRRLAPYRAWLAGKQGRAVEPLGIDRIRALLADDLRPALEALIAEDEARKPEADALAAVERATRYRRDLATLIRNFVNFRQFYGPEHKAMFQTGVLYLDGRSCELVLRVNDVAAHSAAAATSYAYLAYCACERKATGEKMSVVAAFTDGDSDFLTVGRNGLLYDRKGNDWDATVVKVVEQPISIRQAFWAPYKRLVRFVSEQAEKFASDQDKAATTQLTSKATAGIDATRAATVAPPPPPAAPAAPGAPAPAAPPAAATSAFDIGKYAGIFAAVGLALGFVVSTVTMILTAFFGLRIWQMPLAILGLLLVISGPSMLLAAFKLRLRNLAPLLDANGWAINARARINIPFGRSLTRIAALPAGSRRDLSDPYQERGSRAWLWVSAIALVCVVALAWDMGLQAWLATLTAPPTVPVAPAPAPAP